MDDTNSGPPARSAPLKTPWITSLLIGAFYMGCVPAALSESLFPERRWPLWALVLVLWATLWLALVGVGLY
jgi:competence protein ComEC